MESGRSPRAVTRGIHNGRQKETDMRHTAPFYFSRTVRSVQGLLMGLALLIALAPTQTFAAEPLQGNDVTVSRNQVINDDLYAFGGTVTIQGQVNGDVVALGGTVTVD